MSGSVYQGERASFDLTITQVGGTDPLVLTGSTIIAAVIGPSGVLYKSSSADGYDSNGYGLAITDSDAGTVTWVLPPVVTKRLSPGGAYYYQIWRVATNIKEALCELQPLTIYRSMYGI